MNFFDIMDIWFYLGLMMIGISLIVFIDAFLRYSRKKMSDSFVMAWFLFAFVLLILGLALIITGYSYALMCAVVTIASLLLLFLIFTISSMVSELTMKVRELAMQVALLNQENDSLLQQINNLKGQDKDV